MFWSSQGEVFNLIDRLFGQAPSRHGVLARVASLDTEQAADTILEVSGIPQEEKVIILCLTHTPARSKSLSEHC